MSASKQVSLLRVSDKYKIREYIHVQRERAVYTLHHHLMIMASKTHYHFLSCEHQT